MSQDALSRLRGGGSSPALPSSSGTSVAQTSSSIGTVGCVEAEPLGPISLSVPRPEHQRTSNVYVDTPFQHRVAGSRPVAPVAAGTQFIVTGTSRIKNELPTVHGSSSLSVVSRPSTLRRLPSTKKPRSAIGNFPPLQLQETSSISLQKQKAFNPVVLQQPKTFTKDVPEEDSIICSRCGRCRCEACTTPRHPGGVWLCGGKCHCSPSEAVDYLSCFCCVKGILYHCGKDTDEDVPTIDRPCSCTAPDAGLRWACLAAAVVPLPCLLCYWPLTWVRRVCEGTYRRFSTHGCRCISSHTTPDIPRRLQLPPTPPEKRLLQDCV